MFVQSHPFEALVLIGFFLLIAFPVHEFAHAWTAYRLGDGTPKMFGRLTLNPIAHFDRVGGTLLVLSILIAGLPFGFAQTPINPRNLRGRYGEAIVAAAGPLSNLITAAIFAVILRLFIANPDLALANRELVSIIDLIVQLSIILALFNLVPIPPLDGGTILLNLVSPRTAWQIRPILAQYGFFLLLLLIIPLGPGGSVLMRVIGPITDAIYGVLVG